MATKTSSPRTRDPWTQVPEQVVDVLRDLVPRTSKQVIRAIRAEIPEYGRPLTGDFGRAVQSGVDAALRRFLELVEHGEEDVLGPSRTLYHDLGRGEFREGRTLDALLGAYRVGGLVAWQEIVPACEDAAVEPSTLYQLAAAIFAYIHELSAVSAQGFSAERAAVAGAAKAARQELVELLTIRPTADPRAVRVAADRAGYRLPTRVALLVSRSGEPDRLATRAGPGAIGASIAGVTCVLVPDPDGPGRARQIKEALRGEDAALGPAVSPDDAPQTWQWARQTLELIERGAIPERGIVRVEAHLGTILLHTNEELASALATRRLAPLRILPHRSRTELSETLLAWLTHHGDANRAATDLHVHPQTVRYRLNKLRELYGNALDDADTRFELELVLRAAGPKLAELTHG